MRTSMKVRAVLVALTLALLTINARPVLADASGPNAVYLTLTCDGVTYNVVSPSGAAVSAQFVDTNSVSVASLVVVTIGSDTFTFTFGFGHGAALGIQSDVQVCTATEGTATLTIYQFQTPRK